MTAGSCISCSALLPDDSSFCPKCGTPTPTGTGGESGGGTAGGADRRERLAAALGDGYQVGELIGRGGFADVYRVVDLELKRELAAKVLRSDFGPSDEMAERFKQEAQTVAGLRHPGIMPIYSVGRAEDLLYFTMPLIKGVTLREYLADSDDIPVEEVLRIIREAAGALEAAHRAGLVHRDIKPENIMLEGEERHVLVMDFGIAKAAEAEEGAGLTQTGMIIGTPQYMSPEQASGEKVIDARTDIYSLGVIAYQMLSGRLPFEGANIQQIIAKQVSSHPPDLSTLTTGLPAGLSEIVHKCLSKRPSDRWDSMSAMVGELDASFGLRSGDTMMTSLTSEVPSDLVEMSRREWIALGVAGVVVLGLYALPLADPPPVVGVPTVRVAEAESIATAFLTDMGATGVFDRGTRWQKHDSAREFVTQALAPGEAVAWTENHGAVTFWSFQWFRKGREGLWTASVSASGGIHAFDREVRSDAEGARLSVDSARAVAADFMVRVGLEPGEWEEIRANTSQEENRTDHTFSWVRPSGVLTVEQGEEEYTARELAVVTVKGDEVTNFHHSLDVPSIPDSGVFGVIILLAFLPLLGVAVYSLAQALRNRAISWRHPVAAAAAFGLLFVVDGLNGLNLAGTYSPPEAWAVFVGERLGGILIAGIFMVLAMLVGTGASMVMPRSDGAKALYGYELIYTRSWDRSTITKVVMVGYALGGLLLIPHALMNWYASGSMPLSFDGLGISHLNAYGEYLPWFTPITEAILAALALGTFGLMVLGLLSRLSGKGALIIAMVAVMGLFVDVRSLMNGDAIYAMTLLLPVIAWAAMRYGVVAVVIGIFVEEVVTAAGSNLALGGADLRSIGIVSVLAVAIPLALTRVWAPAPKT